MDTLHETSLAECWAFSLDPSDLGFAGHWAAGPLAGGTITIPGILQAQGYGDAVTRDTPSQEIMEVLPALGIRYARTVGSTDNYDLPRDFMAWTATCHHTHNLLAHGREFVELHKTQYLKLLYVWGHSFEFTDEKSWQLMEDFCAMVGGQADIWYATNIEIVDYMEAAKRLRFTAAADQVYNPNFQSVWLEVDGQQLEIPGGQLISL